MNDDDFSFFLMSGKKKMLFYVTRERERLRLDLT